MRRLLLTCLLLAAAPCAFATRIIINNTNTAGVGLNDPTPATPVGGNDGTTIGEQRLNVFKKAAEIWASQLDSSVDILVDASFASLDCTATSAVLGQAYPMGIVRDFDGAPAPGVWYPIALANKLARRDLTAGNAHIHAQFNSRADDAVACPVIGGWYYGFDDKHGLKVDLLVVVLHEMGHGLGFTGVTDSDGKMNKGYPSVFEQHMLDNSTGMHWDQMTDVERKASQTNDQNVVWDGSSSTTAALKYLSGTPTLQISAPASIAKTYRINAAAFGPRPTVAGVNGTLVAATDDVNASGPSSTDGCTAFTNASQIDGHIALVDRGSCYFTVKAKNAQNAGAIAVVIADNVPNTIPPLGGDDSTITIPVVGVTQADGATIRAALDSTVSLLIFSDRGQLAGADTAGHPRLYVPQTYASGSSVYHWDTSAYPNLLMEPNISSDLAPTGVDLTLNEMLDIGWTQPASAPPTGRRILKRGK
jgi:PA domain